MGKKRKNNKKSKASNDIMNALFANTSTVVAETELNLPTKPGSYNPKPLRPSDQGHWRASSFETRDSSNNRDSYNNHSSDEKKHYNTRESWERSSGEVKPDRQSSRGYPPRERHSDTQSSWERSSGEVKPDKHSWKREYIAKKSTEENPKSSFWSNKSTNESSWRSHNNLK